MIFQRALAKMLRFVRDSHSQEFGKCGSGKQDMELASSFFMESLFSWKEPALVFAGIGIKQKLIRHPN